MSETAELDLSQLGETTPQSVKEQYRSVVPQVMAVNPEFQAPQAALEHIRTVEGIYGSRLFGVNLSDEATPLQTKVFNRKLLKVKADLHIVSDDEKQELEDIEGTFSTAADRLSRLRGIPVQEADNILMSVFVYRGLSGVDDAIERLSKGPKIEGFEKTDLFEFDFNNEELRAMLEDSFGLDAILKSRLLEISKVDGFPVQCRDVAFGNDCIPKYGARWEGGFLVLPDRKTYEEVEMQLEGVSKPEDLQHSFKLRAATDTAGGFGTVKVREFVVEQPSHFDYLEGLQMSDQDKMRAYFLGIIAHEAAHSMQAFGINKSVSDEYRSLATQEQSDTLEHKFVTQYVNRHHNIYKSNEYETLGEDFAEAVRIYLTNSDYLKQHFPKRYQFIQQNLPFVNENSIRNFAETRIH